MTEAERKEGSMKSKAQESIADLVQTLYAESAKKANDPFWTKSASNLVEGLLLAMLEDSEIPELGITGERFNLGTVSSTLSLRRTFPLPINKAWVKTDCKSFIR